MEALVRAALAAGIVGLFSQGVLAEDADLPGRPVAEIVRHPIVAHVIEALGDKPRGADEQEKRDAEGLSRFYLTPDRGPVWVSEESILQAARDVAEEIGRADDYGLDAAKLTLPALAGAGQGLEDLARAELMLSRAVLAYARHAKGGRVQPGEVGQQLHDAPALLDPLEVLEAIAAAAEPAAFLRGLHPKHPQFEMLRKKYVALRDAREQRAETQLPKGPVLRRGDSHDHVILLRRRLDIARQEEEGSKEEDDSAKPGDRRFDAAVEDAVKTFQKEAGLKADGIVGPGTRAALNGDSPEKRILTILINMERWRWLPDDLDGDAGIYVWANIPEFRVRIVKGGEVAFSERVIVGKTDKQTPVFSDMMEWIEIHPTWYVPNSIKVEDILPSLRRRTSKIMDRYHLQLNCGRHGSDPANIDWSKVDIRSCSVSQPPGDKSVLGDFKFKFPNKHAVYMHDTLARGLFERGTRTYSHGCIRIRNPRRMAEILLAHDKGMAAERLGQILAGPRRLHKEDLTRPVPVHITYFTALFDEDGKFVTRPDYYGNDRRLAQALTGKGSLLPVVHVAAPRARERRPRTTQRRRWWQHESMQN